MGFSSIPHMQFKKTVLCPKAICIELDYFSSACRSGKGKFQHHLQPTKPLWTAEVARCNLALTTIL